MESICIKVYLKEGELNIAKVYISGSTNIHYLIVFNEPTLATGKF